MVHTDQDSATSIAEDYNLELQYRKPFTEVWNEEKDSPVFGPLSERMGVRGRDAGPLLVSKEEMEAASMKHGHSESGPCTDHMHRLLPCLLLLQDLKAARYHSASTTCTNAVSFHLHWLLRSFAFDGTAASTVPLLLLQSPC